MKLDDRRFFHPSRGEWERVPGRPAAWKLRPNSYIWVPSSQIFPDRSSHRAGMFPREFTLLVTLKLSPVKPMQGTLFSLRSRRQQDAYLSLELEPEDRIRVVHAGKNGTQAVVIPMKLNDGHWHQLGLALQDDNSVRSFVDCAWVSTDILKRNELDHPEDADLIIGYLFQGELEQLVIVPNPSAVAQQCSSSRIPLYDPLLQKIYVTTPMPTFKRSKHGRSTKARKGVKEEEKSATLNSVRIQHKEYIVEDSIVEGSGLGTYNESDYEVEWSEWSECSTTCGTSTQSRFSRCVDDGSRLELCMEAGGERTETRPCPVKPCERSNEIPEASVIASSSDIFFAGQKQLEQNHTKRDEESQPPDVYQSSNQTKKHHKHHKHHRGRYNSSDSWNVLQKRILSAKGLGLKACTCLNGGTCTWPQTTCECPQGYWGRHCEKIECHVDCFHGGYCLTPNTCTCSAKYMGSRCETPVCDPPCQHGGTCVKPGSCACPPQTSGSYCHKFSCRSECLNGGTCVGPDECECPHNVTGSFCQEPVCEPPCENGGSCSAGNTCLCESGSTGIRCEKRRCEYKPVQEPYTKGFRRLVSKKVETKCEPWSWKTCIRTVPEYQTVYKTYYRTVYKCSDIQTNSSQTEKH